VNHTLYVPVRLNPAGVLTLRTGRLESGERTGLAFTCEDALSRTLGPAQKWVSLGEQPLREMLAPLGIQQLRVDPLPFGLPGTRGIPHQARKRPAAHSYTPVTPVTPAHTAAWAMTFRSLSGHHWLRSSPWPGRVHHGRPDAVGRPAGI
jgi:hypothetical protein